TTWRTKLDLEKVEVLYLFGLGDGSAYAHLREWLHADSSRRLVIFEEDLGVIAALFQTEAPWLFDEQIELDVLQELDEWAERYPAKRVEAIALPSFSQARFRRLRLDLLRKTALSHALFLDRLHGYQPFENFVRNVPRIQGAFYGNALKSRFADLPAIVCGAGPSLQKAIPLLKEYDGRALVIAGGSTLAALSSAGYVPHFGVAIDPNLEEYRRFRNSFCFECPLLFSTRVFPAIFRTCSGPFGYLRSGIGGAPELWLEEELQLTDPLLGEHLSDEAVSVTAICLAFAEHIGCKTILLSGVDLAYTGGQRYASGVSEETTLFAEIEAEKGAADRIIRRKDKQGRPVHTAVRWLMEAASLSHYAKKHPDIRWINTTSGGLPIDGFEELPLSEEFFLPEPQDLRQRIANEIIRCPMPQPEKDLLAELKESLERVIAHLEILAGKKKGSSALAEYELQEELATSILFYDMPKVLAQALRRNKSLCRWELYLDTARKYNQMFI
ncbi:MAG: motility associated factor glycosyltransferase family protein, partial [Verrucomicrobiota bacterium]|nr:motility associated factor glycosyltransferase family protein [Verrucomicrobiota bacterium]